MLVLFELHSAAEDKFFVAQMIEFIFEMVKNIVGKGEWLPAFSPFPTKLSKVFPNMVIRTKLFDEGLRL